MTDVLAKRSLC